MKIEFIAGFGPIVREPTESRNWWSALGLDLHEIAPDYYGTDDVDGARAFALWPLAHAAETTARLMSPEGLLVGISYTPWMHGDSQHAE